MIKQIFKRAFGLFGIELKRIVPSPLLHHKIDLIFDVGANSGQYALAKRSEGYDGTIVSFEPLPDVHSVLRREARNDPHWIVHPRSAVGASVGSTTINISKNTCSSSVLPMLDAHASAAPDSVYVGTVETPMITLDSVFDLYARNSSNVLVKLDVQGLEAEVLNGCLTKMGCVKAVQLELSIVPLYQGQELYRYFFDFFEEHNFFLWSIIPGFADQVSGQLLQFDAVFINPSI
mgnify:CR=1 FL=1